MIAFNPPPIRGISTTGGFELYLQDRSGGSLESLSEATQRVIAGGRQRPELTGVSTTFSTGVPQLRVDVDREKAMALGVPINDVFDALQSTMGASTSTTSTCSAAPTASACRRRRRTARSPTTSATSTCARSHGDMMPLKR